MGFETENASVDICNNGEKYFKYSHRSKNRSSMAYEAKTALAHQISLLENMPHLFLNL